jgi:PucR C-terminal helix-turn-helix domain/GGDEF-like domain
MQRARAFESHRQSVPGRGAEESAPRPTPLTLVSGALAGEDLQSVAATVAEALGRPVAIAIPALGEPVVSPVAALSAEQLREISNFAAATARGESAPPPEHISGAAPVRIGEQVVGVAVAGRSDKPAVSATEQTAWLDAAAAAASVTALIRDAREAGPEDVQAGLLWELEAGPAEDLQGFLTRARHLGVELGAGASAICAQRGAEGDGVVLAELAAEHGALLAETPDGQLLGLAPANGGDGAAAIAARLREVGMTVAVSAPHRDPATLHDAVREAELLVELALTPSVHLAGQDETYRLLIGVLLRDPDELGQLRASTILALAEYDDRHDTDLLATLQAFLVHDGSTTETAEAMNLHRHTVGYRLSRVHEVSGLSPYESDGRERLSLGLKAHQIITAAARHGAAPKR